MDSTERPKTPNRPARVHRYPDGPNELWDLVEDPDERDNRINDPSQATRIVDLRQRMEVWFAQHVDPAISGINWQATGSGQMRPVLPGYDDGSEPFKSE